MTKEQEERFDKQFSVENTDGTLMIRDFNDDGDLLTSREVKYFINQIQEETTSKLKEEIEKMRIELEDSRDFTEEGKDGYNQALNDFQEVLDKLTN